jgi:hypothetical protein
LPREKNQSIIRNEFLEGHVLTVITKTLSGRAYFSIVANVAALVASTTRE